IVLVVILLPLLLCHSLRDCTGNHRALPPFPTRRSSDLEVAEARFYVTAFRIDILPAFAQPVDDLIRLAPGIDGHAAIAGTLGAIDRKSTRLNSSHVKTSYAVFCLKKKTITCISHDDNRD